MDGNCYQCIVKQIKYVTKSTIYVTNLIDGAYFKVSELYIHENCKMLGMK